MKYHYLLTIILFISYGPYKITVNSKYAGLYDFKN